MLLLFIHTVMKSNIAQIYISIYHRDRYLFTIIQHISGDESTDPCGAIRSIVGQIEDKRPWLRQFSVKNGTNVPRNTRKRPIVILRLPWRPPGLVRMRLSAR